MSTRKHKRRRLDTDAQHLFDDEVSPQKPTADAEELAELELARLAQEPHPEVEEDAEASAKEREVWDAFREEHYELLEQLPLSLHRAFTLIHELDQQAQDNITHLAPAVLKYVSLRKALAAPAEPKPDAPQDSPEASDTTNGKVDGASNVSLTNGKPTNGFASSSVAASTPGPSSKRPTPPSTSRSLASVVENSTSTRELLIHIAQSSEEVTRACAEKVYLAQHAYDLVDRYIRDLDRAVKEQEASVTLGMRAGTHPASIILPEVVAPVSSRGRVVATPPPVSMVAPIPILVSSPAPAPAPTPAPIELPEEPEEPEEPEDSEEPTVEPVEIEVDVVTDEPMEEEPPPPEPPKQPELPELPEIPEPPEPPELPEPPAPEPSMEAEAATTEPAPPPSKEKKKGKKRRKGAGRRQTEQAEGEAAVAPAPDTTEDVDVVALEPEAQPTLTLRIPAQILPHAVIDDLPPDPNEPRYCFCNQVSFGDMIACDNPTCTREWFHIGCVGLTKIPKGNWYCRECAALRKRPKSRKRAR
ncbi:uncharacterized protein TRAVEDRAFT_45923 [Trametes versicolor FP-101664 SS1]|uniref:uncharacterized protein n=1 Tax=Trametes versicolor (strain FP-101664) TaxID=717944 RepID=UPI0004623B87|nr:uncharacterized protein TRAVEDRAFT_45923 [Trametes versicolor FP-101664 SS1]EIW60680.1 hypothetical protein TRAVEDRAFT_45923 [Trametes versicolor FP-101664 SS1]